MKNGDSKTQLEHDAERYGWDLTQEDPCSHHEKLALIGKINSPENQGTMPVVVNVTIPNAAPGFIAYSYSAWMRCENGYFYIFPNSGAHPILAYADGSMNHLSNYNPYVAYIRTWYDNNDNQSDDETAT